ncbi:MAG TPA: cell envelope integrity protein TolA [Gallionellaceae bacterium]|nr:cell envelope integrity protein TolA [Gallionellaceae bacterium]
MSTALTYQEPYRLPAGMLALAVHLLFFFVLYFGFRWQAQPPEEFMVEMWDSLPAAEVAPEQLLEPPVKAESKPLPKVVAPVLPPVKADIEVRDKKKKQAEEKAKAAAATKAKQEKELRELEAYSERLRNSEQARIRAEVDAATATQVGRYQDMIRAKIRRNIVMPPDVPESAKAEFKVTLLPGGDVLDVELLRSSGHTAYDNAAERAIYKAQPLPVPTNADLQKMFRELKLTIRP